MDVLSVRNVYEDAERAKDKKAAIGADVTIENFSDETVNALDMIDDLDDLSNQTKKDLLKVGVDTEENNRSGSFLQVDQSNIFTNNSMSDSIEVMNMAVALDKYSWLDDYLWNVVKPDADKYTAKTAINEKENGIVSGYFVRSLPGTKEVMPVQACMFISDTDIMQTAHNVIIAEENSELHLITGCATGDDISSAMHVGAAINLADNSTYINNYILTSPVSTIQSFPTAYCNGENSRAIFQSIQGGKKDSIIDVGSRVLLNAKGAKGEVISRAVAQDESQIYARGHLAGTVPEVKGHLECHGLVLSDDSFIYAVPELEASSANLEMSHEAAVGKISEDEINYLTSRGISEEDAESMIVRGFLNMDITGLPDELAQQTQNMIDMSLDGM